MIASFLPCVHLHAAAMLYRYIEFSYNRQRSHSTLGFKCPIDNERELRFSSLNCLYKIGSSPALHLILLRMIRIAMIKSYFCYITVIFAFGYTAHCAGRDVTDDAQPVDLCYSEIERIYDRVLSDSAFVYACYKKIIDSSLIAPTFVHPQEAFDENSDSAIVRLKRFHDFTKIRTYISRTARIVSKFNNTYHIEMFFTSTAGKPGRYRLLVVYRGPDRYYIKSIIPVSGMEQESR